MQLREGRTNQLKLTEFCFDGWIHCSDRLAGVLQSQKASLDAGLHQTDAVEGYWLGAQLKDAA